MRENDLKYRTRDFAISILQLVNDMGNKRSDSIISNQLGRSATSQAANYWAACRARSLKEFISKMGIALEECDESYFWLDLLLELRPGDQNIFDLKKEAYELTAIFISSLKTAKANYLNHK